MTIKINNLAEALESNNDFAANLGTKLAEYLKLRKDVDHNDRFDLHGGTKTVIGVAKTIVRAIDESGAGAESEVTGKRIADWAKMRTAPAYAHRYLTSEGTKSGEGIAGSVQRLIAEAIAEIPAINDDDNAHLGM